MIYRPAFTDNKLLPSPQEAVDALKAADAADSAQDCRMLHAIIMRIINLDGKVGAFANIRKVGVSSTEWTITANEDKDQERADEAKQRLTKVIKTILNEYWQCAVMGVFAMNIEWVKSENSNILIPTIAKIYHPTELNWARFAENMSTWDVTGKKIPLISENRTIFLVATDGVEAGGALRSMILNEIIKSDMIQEWSNYNLRIKGILKAGVDDSTSKEDIDDAKRALADAQKSQAFVAESRMSFDLLETASTAGTNSFEKIIAFIDKSASIRLLGQANVSELPDKSGSRAATEVQRMITADISFGDQSNCEELINNQLLKYDYNLNIDSNANEAAWKFHFVWQEEFDPETKVAMVAGMLDAGLPLMSDEVYKFLGFKKPVDVPDVIVGGNNVKI